MNIFSRGEILRTEKFYLFRRRCKLITFVPEKYHLKILKSLSQAGAGKIGKYVQCSFSTKGAGTFVPLEGTDPYSGEKGKLSIEEELKFEIECDASELNYVIDVLHKVHPYEEIAYELHEFYKRDTVVAGRLYRLKKPAALNMIISRLNRKLVHENIDLEKHVSSIAVSHSDERDELLRSAHITNCDLIIGLGKTKKKIELIFT